jgi:hypothetical protein
MGVSGAVQHDALEAQLSEAALELHDQLHPFLSGNIKKAPNPPIDFSGPTIRLAGLIAKESSCCFFQAER